mmetsp:Transcript_3022/g.9178  ORF Transcript_3022/g.9178 Transcript_3022/m.9178 type:complete len:106 (+) Transcript_3022:155-472(+)
MVATATALFSLSKPPLTIFKQFGAEACYGGDEGHGDALGQNALLAGDRRDRRDRRRRRQRRTMPSSEPKATESLSGATATSNTTPRCPRSVDRSSADDACQTLTK